MRVSRTSFIMILAAGVLTFGCSSNDAAAPAAQGGSKSDGGTKAQTGATAAGGATASGGGTQSGGGTSSVSSTSGGASSPSSGGSASDGNSSPSGGAKTSNSSSRVSMGGSSPSAGGSSSKGGASNSVAPSNAGTSGGSGTPKAGAGSGGASGAGTATKGGANSGGSTSGGAGGDASATGGASSAGSPSVAGSSSGKSNTHMYTDGSDLYAHCGEKVLLRGVNQMSIWTDATGSSYPAIASLGTNAIRIVYTESGDAAGLDALLTKAEANKMIPMPELHDATGKFDLVPAAVTWWTQPDVVNVIKKHEKWALLNIANEAGDSNVSDSTFQSTYTTAITSIRNAGITVPIVIDGSGWGQKAEQLLTVAPALLAADPQKNVIFSWHEYTGGSQENARITTNLEKSKTLGVVLINGEFANGGAGTCATDIPYKFLIAEAQRIGTGWLAWSWDSSNSDCKSGGTSIFNMTTDITSASGLASGWASDVVRDDPNSIKNTSVRPCEWK